MADRDDVAAGRDTVVEAAIRWISDSPAPTTTNRSTTLACISHRVSTAGDYEHGYNHAAQPEVNSMATSRGWRKTLRVLALGCGTIALLFGALVVWVGIDILPSHSAN